MPQGDRRWAFIRNTSVLLILSRVLPSAAANGHQYWYDAPVQSSSPSTTGNFQDSIVERQLPGNVITLALPLPTPIPLPTNPNPIPNGSPIPLLISPYLLSSPPPSVSPSRTSSSLFVPTKTSASMSSQSGNSSTTTNNVNNSNRLTAINFLPFIILTSFFIISLMGWCLHGWCTRRPKQNFVAVGTQESTKKKNRWFWRRRGGWREGNDELVCGPAYESFVGQDIEEFATVRQPGRYQWPPRSATNQGHRYQLSQNGEDPFLSKSIPPEFVGLPIQTVRSVPSADPPREPNVGRTLMSPTTTTGPMSPTSIALRELYEVVLRNEYDGPSGEERPTLLGIGSGVMRGANRSTSGRKRKPHVRKGSESHDEATQFLGVGGRWRGGILSDDDSDRLPRKKLEVRNPSVGEGRLGLREEDGILDEEDQYMPLPTPTRIVHQFPAVQPSTPRGRKARGEVMGESQNIPSSISTDVLPAHPRQIMSPPLESQIYFIPMPTTAEEESAGDNDRRSDGLVGLASSPARVRGGVRPKTRASNPRSLSRERFGEQNRVMHYLPEVADDRLGFRGPVTTSPLRIATGKVKNEYQPTSGHHNGARKGKGKLVKASPAARSRAKQTAGED